MRKFRAAMVVLILCCFLPVMSALAGTGTVTANSLNVRQTASAEGKVIKVLKKGAKVTINGTKGSWYKITVNGKTGYVAKKYIKTGSSDSSTSSSSSSSSTKKSSTVKADNSLKGTCSVGDTGSDVKAVQKRLKTLGFYTGTVDGDYGNNTKKAVIAFQKKNGLKQTGSVNSATLKKLKSSDVKMADSSGSTTSATEELYWFKGGSKAIPKGATFKVKDIKTGKVFTCKRWSGANHLDAEPLTASDTATMKSIFGGSWSWRRRAVLVKYNGHVYAASMNGMPHGTQTISNNNFDGHFCIHFTGSKTHGSKKVDATHQNCVKNAAKHSW